MFELKPLNGVDYVTNKNIVSLETSPIEQC